MPKIMVFASHPDDETIGCGGLILKNSNQVIVVFLTNGTSQKGIRRINKQESTNRESEAVQALKLAGVQRKNMIFLDNDCYFGLDKEKLNKTRGIITKILKKYRPDQIYVTAYEGGHFDHDITNFLINQSAKTLNYKPRIYEYPLYNNNPSSVLRKAIRKLSLYMKMPRTEPTFIKIKGVETYRLPMNSEELRKKRTMLEAYRSQNKKNILVKLYLYNDKFRPCPNYDYNKRPHKILPLNYEITTKIKFSDFLRAIR